MLNVILLSSPPELLTYLTQGGEDNHCWKWKQWRKDGAACFAPMKKLGAEKWTTPRTPLKNLPSLCSWLITPRLPGTLAVYLWACPSLGQLSHVIPNGPSAALQKRHSQVEGFTGSQSEQPKAPPPAGQESAFKFLRWFYQCSLCCVVFCTFFRQKFRLHMCLLLDNVLSLCKFRKFAITLKSCSFQIFR